MSDSRSSRTAPTRPDSYRVVSSFRRLLVLVSVRGGRHQAGSDRKGDQPEPETLRRGIPGRPGRLLLEIRGMGQSVRRRQVGCGQGVGANC